MADIPVHLPPRPAARRPARSADEGASGDIREFFAGPWLTRADRPRAAVAALTHGETRVLHYLPTNLSAREIACELYLSVNTIKTHQRHLYQKLGARSRSQAVRRARALGLLAPPSHGVTRKITPT